MKHSKLPIIVGPTGVGKSEVAYQLALQTGAEIISADAFQVYQGTEIGTAQPPKEWQKKVPHHLIGTRKPSEPWNAVEFSRLARKILDEGWAQRKKFLVVGGAGFYLKALVEGGPEGEASSPEIRSMVADKINKLGNEKAYALLKERDSEAAKRIHENDVRRISRALEKTYTETKTSSASEALGAKKVEFFGLERSREKLDSILKTRTTTMWEKGLLEETKKLMDKGFQESHPLWNAIGYAEAAAFLRGNLAETEALEKIFRRTRQYAKRQWTWFKHQHDVKWINLDSFSDILEAVSLLEKKIQNC